MAESSEAEAFAGVPAPPNGAGIYLDSSAFAKLYVPEADSERLDAFLRGRRGLMISELAITEVLSAVARRKRSFAPIRRTRFVTRYWRMPIPAHSNGWI
jgi:predicted nucleic acid-binding protein